MTVASRRLTDLLRSEQARQRRESVVAERTLPEELLAPGPDAPRFDSDDTLILVFMCCNPSLSPASASADRGCPESAGGADVPYERRRGVPRS
jgi:predicted RNA polymerase sigma factor